MIDDLSISGEALLLWASIPEATIEKTGCWVRVDGSKEDLMREIQRVLGSADPVEHIRGMVRGAVIEVDVLDSGTVTGHITGSPEQVQAAIAAGLSVAEAEAEEE